MKYRNADHVVLIITPIYKRLSNKREWNTCGDKVSDIKHRSDRQFGRFRVKREVERNKESFAARFCQAKASVKMLIFIPGISSRARTQASSVEPVVRTSSTSNICLPSNAVVLLSANIPSVFS